MQTHEERVIGGRLEDVLLRLHPVNVLVVGDQRLLDHLHRVDSPRALQLDHQHLGVRATTDNPDQLKVAERVLSLHVTGTLCTRHSVQRQLLALVATSAACKDYFIIIIIIKYNIQINRATLSVNFSV